MNHYTLLDTILGAVVERLDADLSRCGFMYHIFWRTKSELSIKEKLLKKADGYRREGKKMQDLLALRITLYFSDDVEILHQYLHTQSNYVDETIDTDDDRTFCPKRLNMVMRVPDDWQKEMIDYLNRTYPDCSDLLDTTYEIQIRTILSEGWHEVEHDLRYKCQEDWEDFREESRLLNGIFATLESSEWSMLTLFDKMAYSFYKKRNWTNMVRNKMRLRFKDKSLSEKVNTYLVEHPDVGKKLYKVRRKKVIDFVLKNDFQFPLQYDTVIHLLNRVDVQDEALKSLEKAPLKALLDRLCEE
jgi:ppGpp synthetase/RelA/SpoT-type nucleotidyltranferase